MRNKGGLHETDRDSLLSLLLVLSLGACGQPDAASSTASAPLSLNAASAPVKAESTPDEMKVNDVQVPENFILISGGSFTMGSPESENWRSEDEIRHTVSVSDFYMGRYEVTQAEYQEAMGENPSGFSGENLPVEGLSWLDAVRYCNARSELENLTPAYHIEDMGQYDTILIGYPNWWASIPMPVASFLEEYDFSGKTIVPFCSHGGGRFGQSLTAISKLVPGAVMGEGLSVHYSGGASLAGDVSA